MLEEEAAKEKITVNSIVSRMIWNYQKRCQYCLHYNLMLVEPNVFKTMLDNMTEDAFNENWRIVGAVCYKGEFSKTGNEHRQTLY